MPSHNAIVAESLTVDRLELGSPPVMDLALVKQYLRVSFSDTDAILELMMLQAIEAFENATHRTVFSRPHAWVLADFPRGADTRIRLPRGVTRSVQSIEVATSTGFSSLFGPTSAVSPVGDDFTEDLTPEEGGIIAPVSGWPTVNTDAPAPVTINFTAGWLPEELPRDVLLALMYGVQVAYDDMRGGAPASGVRDAQTVLETLRSPYRLTRWY